MRVLLLSPGYPPMHGGGEAYAQGLASELAYRGHEITVVTSAAAHQADYWHGTPKGVARSEAMVDGVRVISLPVRPAFLGRQGQLALRKAMVVASGGGKLFGPTLEAWSANYPPIVGLAGELECLPRADIIHSLNLSWEHCIVAGRRLSQQTDVPHVISPFLHVGAAEHSRVWRNNSMVHQRRALVEAAAVLPLTDTERDGLRQFGVSPDRLYTVGAATPRDTLDLANIPPDPRVVSRLGQGETPIFLFLGRVDRNKGALVAMHAAAFLRLRGVPGQLALAGSPSPEAARVANALVDGGAPIHLLGPVAEGTKHWLLSHCTALVFPSSVESFGLVVLEAWQYGKPVIAADVGGLHDVVEHEVNGLHVPWGDMLALALAMQRLVNDAALAHRLGAAGRERVAERYTWPAVADRVESAYERALGGHPPAD